MPDDETLVRERLLRLSQARSGSQAIRAAARLDTAATAVREPSQPQPASLASGAFDPGRRGVKALAAVAAVVVLGAAIWAWQSRPHPEPVAAEAPPAIQSTSTTPERSGGTTELVVAVAGKVRHPGLIRLPAGARVADAIAKAGGVLPGTDITLLNLARKVSDGELIVVGVTPPPVSGGQPGTGAGTGVSTGKVDLNTATQAQLETLPGVGPVLAQRILAYREQHGRFRSVGELRQVSGIGDARYEQLKDLVSV